MAVINLLPPVVTSDIDLMRVQQRFDGPVSALISTPWGNGTLVSGINLQRIVGNQQLVFRHGLGRRVTGAIVWNCNVQVSGPWGLLVVDNNNCTLNVNLPAGVGATVSGSIDIWVG